jgi:hypothetical protein
MKLIPLSQGLYAQVDDQDFEWLSKWKWSAVLKHNVWYAVRRPEKHGRRRTVYMHREIMGFPDGKHIDHIDRDGLNNRRSNLRICSAAQNQRNRGKQVNNAAGHKGVSWNWQKRKWEARINARGKRKFLGYFDSPEEAAFAYDRAAVQYYGEFAKLNFPNTVEPDLLDLAGSLNIKQTTLCN